MPRKPSSITHVPLLKSPRCGKEARSHRKGASHRGALLHVSGELAWIKLARPRELDERQTGERQAAVGALFPFARMEMRRGGRRKFRALARRTELNAHRLQGHHHRTPPAALSKQTTCHVCDCDACLSHAATGARGDDAIRARIDWFDSVSAGSAHRCAGNHHSGVQHPDAPRSARRHDERRGLHFARRA